MNALDAIKFILRPLASLRLTIALLLISMFLVFAGTTAQKEMGIVAVQHEFFHSWVAHIYPRYIFLPFTQPDKYPDWASKLPREFPRAMAMPGGYTLIVLMLVNLLAAHIVRFKLRIKRTGIILIHLGLIMLLVSEFLTSITAVENQMAINVGQTVNYAIDSRSVELAFVDPSPSDHDNVIVVPEPLLRDSVGKTIHDTALPFDIRVDKWYPNSSVHGPMETEPGIDRMATGGGGAGGPASVGLRQEPRVSGTGSDASQGDEPAAFITIIQGGQPLGTYGVSLHFSSQQVQTPDKRYLMELRFTRYYKPYTITLKHFTHTLIPGTDMARDFASTIRLLDPKNNVDREVRIWMNNPLRYNGETFYQSSFANNDTTSILQVVHNRFWTMPYIACIVGTLGLLVHFGISLIGFLRRKLAPAEGTVGAQRGGKSRPPIPQSSRGARDGSVGVKSSRGDQPISQYTLHPEPIWKKLAMPAIVVSLVLVYIASKALVSRVATQPYNLNAAAHIPIFADGRIQPLESAARNFLGVINGGKTSYADGHGDPHPAIEWLFDTMTQSGTWDKDKVIRIDNPQIKGLLKLEPEEKLFSWNDLHLDDEAVRSELDRQNQLASSVPEKNRDEFQRAILDLNSHLHILTKLFQISSVVDLSQSDANEMRESLRQAMSEKADPASLTPRQHAILRDLSMLDSIHRLGPEAQLLLIPPTAQVSISATNPSTDHADEWKPIVVGVLEADANPQVKALIAVLRDYTDRNPQAFNADVEAYQKSIATVPGLEKVSFEVGYDRFDPLLISMVLYVAIFILGFLSWVALRKSMWNTGFALMMIALLLHTGGIVARIYISGRPPVVNLYSAAVFIGWGVVLMSLLIEAIYRNGTGLVVGSMTGFLSLLVAAGFAAGEGDTMRQLQAVLDTNIWLATHVVCVSLGYMASVLAGMFATLYIVRRLVDPTFVGADSKDVSRITYGIVCFAMLFSFVGTILGGIWADQSWGRFWGWDPKENGAVLVVLWNALILHSRWSGVVRERGMAVLAVLGNIIVGWSYVGTNLLGIGLHSYGFMSGIHGALMAWVIYNVAVAIVGIALIRPDARAARPT